MWITFKICIFVIWNNAKENIQRRRRVVNYFQNLYFCDLKQPKQINAGSGWRCELLSKFVSLWLPTTGRHGKSYRYLLWITFKICIFVTPNNSQTQLGWYRWLWITFKICIFVISNNFLLRLTLMRMVVNYFQNLYLCDFQQLIYIDYLQLISCELLSKFVSLWFETTNKLFSRLEN